MHGLYRPKRPKNLQVYAFSPGGAVKKQDLDAGLGVLKAAGADVKLDPRAMGRNPKWPYLAGTLKERANGIIEALSGRYGAAIATRGGYGSLQAGILAIKHVQPLDFPVLMGFSDVTALHALLNARGLVTVHGPNLSGLANLEEASVKRALDVMSGRAGDLSLDGLLPVSDRTRIAGVLLGGNLSVWCSMVGTGAIPDTTGAILLLEEVNEPVYRLHRMLMQIRLALRENPPGAVVFGDLGMVATQDKQALDYVLSEFAKDIGVPVVMGAPVGHGQRNMAVALGLEYELDPVRGTLMPLNELYREG